MIITLVQHEIRGNSVSAGRFDDLLDPPRRVSKEALARSATKVGILQIGQKVFDFGFTILLARLLTPADFGVVAAAVIFIQFAQLLVEIGIGATLIQAASLTVPDLRAASAVMFLSAAIYTGLTLLIASGAEAFMGIPGVMIVLQVLSLQFLLQMPGIVPEAILIRRLEAARVAKVQFVTRVLMSGVAGIVLALAGWGYWSIVISTLLGVAMKSVAYQVMVQPPLRPLFSLTLSRRLLRTGAGFSASRLINFAALRGDNLMVGRFFDATSLGLYSRAYNLMTLPAEMYALVADRLLFPAMSAARADAPRFKRAFSASLELTASVGLPLSVILYLLGPELILVLLGEKWLGAVPLFQVLAVVTYFRLGMKVVASVQRARAAVESMIWTQALYAALTVGGCVVFYRYGLQALAGAVSLGVFIAYVAMSRSACRLTGVTLGEFLGLHRHGLILSAALGGITYGAMMTAGLVTNLPFFHLALTSVMIGLCSLVILMVGNEKLLGKSVYGLADFLRLRIARRRIFTERT